MAAVYERFYELRVDPFGLSPDARLSFGHPGYQQAKAYLQYALGRGEGLTVLTGAAGTGKTTLLNDVLGRTSNARVEVIVPPRARFSPRALRHLLATSLGVSCQQAHGAALLLEIREALIRRQGKCQRVVLMVDEAHDLSDRALEELRLLADMQHRGRLMLQVFLAGQERLLERMRAPGMEHLRQRVIAAAHLDPLSVEETAAYIAYRLRRAGWKQGPSITLSAVQAIHDFSGGIPRRVNLICSRLLVLGMVEEKCRLDRDDAETVIAAVRAEMPFGHSDPGLQAGRQRATAESKRADRQQTGAEPLVPALPDKPTELADAAAPLALLDDAAGKRSREDRVIPGLELLPDWRAGAESSASGQLPCPQTGDGLVDPDLTRVRFEGSSDPRGEGAGGLGDNATQAALKDLSGSTGRTIHLLCSPRTKIGRPTDAENTAGAGISVKCLWVSRNHALIERRDCSYWVTDLGSVNGTYVNNERISGQRRLCDGDTVRVARYEFEFTSASHFLRSA